MLPSAFPLRRILSLSEITQLESLPGEPPRPRSALDFTATQPSLRASSPAGALFASSMLPNKRGNIAFPSDYFYVDRSKSRRLPPDIMDFCGNYRDGEGARVDYGDDNEPVKKYRPLVQSGGSVGFSFNVSLPSEDRDLTISEQMRTMENVHFFYQSQDPAFESTSTPSSPNMEDDMTERSLSLLPKSIETTLGNRAVPFAASEDIKEDSMPLDRGSAAIKSRFSLPGAKNKKISSSAFTPRYLSPASEPLASSSDSEDERSSQSRMPWEDDSSFYLDQAAAGKMSQDPSDDEDL